MNIISKLSVRVRMTLAFGFMVIALASLGGYAMYSLNIVNNQSTVMDEQWIPGINYAHSMNTMSSDFRIMEYRHIVSIDATEMDNTETEMERLSEEIQKNITEYEKVVSSSDEARQKLEIVKTEWSEYLELNRRVIAVSREHRTQDAMAIMRGESREAFDNAANALLELVKFNQDNASSASKEGDEIFADTMQVMIISIVIVSILAVLIALYIINGIVKPVNKLAESAERIADGDLNVDIDVSSNDEIGKLAKSFSIMTENINDILMNISAASEQVASGSKQVSDSSMLLSQGATEQASSIEQLTASLEEISSQTNLNAQSANQANELAEVAKANAVQGDNQMKEMLKAMDEINDASNNISKIIKVIDEIAFQTNILALNAAVEAARAGQHGKGFAVVAEEVRNLAARSANAAKETTAMIEGSIKKVEGGTNIANETASALNKIVDGIAKVANLVSDIAVASSEQASGIEQVNQGVIQISEVVQNNSATSEESAAASEELAGQAHMLEEQVSRFKLKRAGRSASYYKGMQELNPEVLKTLDNMSKKKKSVANSEVYAEAATAHSKKIALSDKEFGKY